jgi:hypothetical protein
MLFEGSLFPFNAKQKFTLACVCSNPISNKTFILVVWIESGFACFSVHSLAVWMNRGMFSLYWLATTASCGLGRVSFPRKKNYSLGSGTHINAWIDSKAVLMLSAGDHSFLRMSRQIAPVWLEMFGCQILVSNFIFGG